ncbi:hypothetical protein KAR91_70645 [Candidatus Pacearchaeota archaeon]|nr:hypothetical protein [Candidatus Pacearchaeota archaeon]
MKAPEAKQIISNILEWQFVLNEIKHKSDLKLHDIDMRQYSLSDFIEANRIVHVCNKKSRVMYVCLKKSGKKTNGFKTHMTCHDRLLAAVYTIINYDSDKQFVAAYDNKGTAILELKYS